MATITKQAVPNTVVPVGALLTPGGDQGLPGAPGAPGPTAVSTDPTNLATLGTDNLLYVPSSNPAGVVLGATSPVANFPNGLVVPSYLNHPDSIWNYGTYDDHFDGTTLAPKWTQTPGGGFITVGGSMVSLNSYPGPAQETSIRQTMPSGQSFTITLKIRACGVIGTPDVGNAWFYSQLSLHSANRIGFVQWFYGYVADPAYSNLTTNTGNLGIGGGANAATLFYNYIWSGELIPYWRIQFTWAGRATMVLCSWDARTWFEFNGVPGNLSGFNTNPPTLFTLSADSNSNSSTYVACDWFRVTTP